MSAQVYNTWAAFKEEVENRYGLTAQQCVDAVFTLEQSQNESTASFILRLEDARARYGISEAEMYRFFRTRLSPAEKAKVDDMCD